MSNTIYATDLPTNFDLVSSDSYITLKAYKEVDGEYEEIDGKTFLKSEIEDQLQNNDLTTIASNIFGLNITKDITE